MSRKFAEVSTRLIATVLVAVLLVPLPATAARDFTSAHSSGDDYKEAVHGAGHVEGDIWGGEQGVDPPGIAPIGPIVGESTPLINTLPGGDRPKPAPAPAGGQIAWLVQLASFFDWLGTTLRFPNL